MCLWFVVAPSPCNFGLVVCFVLLMWVKLHLLFAANVFVVAGLPQVGNGKMGISLLMMGMIRWRLAGSYIFG